MKKIFALVLAVAMLSTTAFAADQLSAGLTNLSPDETYAIKDTDFGFKALNGDFTSANFNITSKKFSKGSNLVKSVAFNDDDGVIELKTVANQTLVAPTNNNLIIEKIEVKAKKDVKVNGTVEVKRNTSAKYAGNPYFTVGYAKDEVALTSSATYAANGLRKFVKDGDNTYGTVSYAGLNDLYIEGRVYAGDKIFTNFDSKPGDDGKAALKAYPEADLRFVNITTSGFSGNNDVTILAAENEFVYEIVDGKVVASKLKWSADDWGFKGKIRSSAKYIISDKELKAVAAAPDEAAKNPETGANDVVGVAAALAVVSLVAAGAVSMKK